MRNVVQYPRFSYRELRNTPGLALTSVLILVCFCFIAKAQAPPSDVKTMETLLAEVHQLRIALERSIQIAPRIQIAVERLKLQQDQVARVARQMDDLRRELDRSRSDQPKIHERLQEIAAAATQNTDPQKRKDLDDALSMFKLEAEQAEKSLQQIQAREGELASRLQSEQARLTELNDRLDQIERALNAP
jgi:chromosome segregation ATPase